MENRSYVTRIILPGANKNANKVAVLDGTPIGTSPVNNDGGLTGDTPVPSADSPSTDEPTAPATEPRRRGRPPKTTP